MPDRISAVPLYGVAIQEAVESSDVKKLQELHKTLSGMLEQVESALGGRAPAAESVVLYGVVIQDAVRRGDKAKMRSMLAQLDSVRGDLKKAMS